MIPAVNGRKVLQAVLFVLVTSGFGGQQAAAQWGFGGMGFGFFGGFGGQVPQPGNFLNDVALAQMGHVKGPPGTNPTTGGFSPYAGNPNAYYNHVRDNGFVDQYSPYRREPSYYRNPSRTAAQRMTSTAMTVAQTRPVVPLASFYNAQQQLVWPGDAPTADALKDQRLIADQASLAVLDEARKNGVASIAAVTDARQKLLDYGRPALKYVRTHETPRVADSFHGFLLELYDALAQAANPTGAPAS
jgi:hypothetical protein